jgi:hypothetical protein
MCWSINHINTKTSPHHYPQQQEAKAEAHRAVILQREARVRAQVEAKQVKKAHEVLAARQRAEKRIRAALERNQRAQWAKRVDYEQRVATAAVRAEEKQRAMLQVGFRGWFWCFVCVKWIGLIGYRHTQTVAQLAEARRQRQERRDQRLVDAMEGLKARIGRTLQRAADRSGFHAQAEAQRARQAAVARVEEQLRREDKEANARRLRRQQVGFGW